MARSRVSVAVALSAAFVGGSVTRALAQAPAPPQGSSWIEAGGFYHRVDHGFGSWKGGYARTVLAGARNVWYLDARAQDAFKDRGVYGSLANVHVFSSRFYTQLGLGAGTGKYVLPDLRLDASLNLKWGAAKALVLTAGGTWVKSKSIYEDQALFGSLFWYASGNALFEVGGRVNWSDPGAVRSERVNGSLTLGRVGRALLTLRGGAGTEGYQIVGPAQALQKFRSQEAGLVWRQWLSRRFGTVLGGDWYHNPFYTRAGVSLGLFRAW